MVRMNPTTLSALAEPNRLHIVELLCNKPLPVNEIVSRLHLHQPQVSKHLKVLTEAGLVNVQYEAQKHIYALRAEPLEELDSWLHQYRQLWENRFDALDMLLQEEKKI